MSRKITLAFNCPKCGHASNSAIRVHGRLARLRCQCENCGALAEASNLYLIAGAYGALMGLFAAILLVIVWTVWSPDISPGLILLGLALPVAGISWLIWPRYWKRLSHWVLVGANP